MSKADLAAGVAPLTHSVDDKVSIPETIVKPSST